MIKSNAHLSRDAIDKYECIVEISGKTVVMQFPLQSFLKTIGLTLAYTCIRLSLLNILRTSARFDGNCRSIEGNKTFNPLLANRHGCVICKTVWIRMRRRLTRRLIRIQAVLNSVNSSIKYYWKLTVLNLNKLKDNRNRNRNRTEPN